MDKCDCKNECKNIDFFIQFAYQKVFLNHKIVIKKFPHLFNQKVFSLQLFK